MINKRKYEQLLNNTIKEINKDDKKTINELLTYINENKPKSLFHYRSCNERSIEAFRENKIYFNTASNFNDPYDCLIYCDIEYILKQIQNMFNYENIKKQNNKVIDESYLNTRPVTIPEEKAKEILLEKEIQILVDLNDGQYSATAWGCDLTYDYVRINGDYRS